VAGCPVRSSGSTCEVLGLGAVAVDDVLFVERYPLPDTKTPVLRRERHCGGLAATALVAARRLGSGCAYAGTLGFDDLSEFAIQCLAREGIDVSHAVRRTGARPIHSTIIINEVDGTRNIFFDLSCVVGADPDLPDADVIRSSAVLLVDHIGVEGMIRAAGIARDRGIPVVADFEGGLDDKLFPQLLNLSNHLILSEGFAEKMTSERQPAAAASALLTPRRDAVVITCGNRGAWYVSQADGLPRHQPAFPVKVVDTTGCGDVFHGVYAAMLVRGLDLAERVRVAAAAAAMNATRSGSEGGAPTWSAVAMFLEGGVRK
jgi:sulfofructose kinase